jgi:hypothetical protein
LQPGQGGFEALRRLWISPVSRADLREVSANLPNCKVSNRNQLASAEQFYQ